MSSQVTQILRRRTADGRRAVLIMSILPILLICTLSQPGRADVTVRNFDGSGGTARTNQIARTDVNGNKLLTGDLGTLEQFPGASTVYFYTPDYSRGVLIGQNSNLFNGFAVYTSSDLVQWSSAGSVDGVHMINPSGWQTVCNGLGTSSCWQPNLVFNTANGNYVLWTTNTEQLITAVCTSQTGGCGSPSVTSSCGSGGDEIYGGYVFVDAGGTAYVVFTDRSAGFVTNVQQLNANYTDCTGSPTSLGDSNREALSLFKRGSTYYIIKGPTCPYCKAGVASSYVTSSSLPGSWSSETEIDSDSSCLGQHAGTDHLVLGGNDVYLYTAQQWDPGNAVTDGSANQSMSNQFWSPLTFSAGAINTFSCAATFTLQGLASAAPPDLTITDQTDENQPSNSLCDVAGNTERAQTFTAGKSGPIYQIWLRTGQGNQSCTLDACASATGVNADLTVLLTTVSGGVPGSTLATMTVPRSGEGWSPTRHKIAVTGNPSLTNGTQYAIVLSSAGATVGCWSHMYGNQTPYAGGGELLSSNGGSSWAAVAGTSLMFSTVMSDQHPGQGVRVIWLSVLHLLMLIVGFGLESGVVILAWRSRDARHQIPQVSLQRHAGEIPHRPEIPVSPEIPVNSCDKVEHPR